MTSITNNSICCKIAGNAVKALLYEVSVSPKPGLVDRFNSGAHKDMDFFTFMSSASVLFPAFYDCAQIGRENCHRDISQIFELIRPVGIRGETAMFEATAGINTHKGLIFSLGIISAIWGYLYGKSGEEAITADEICTLAGEMTKGIAVRELSLTGDKKDLTHGERLFMEYGIKGIRGEAESGFETVKRVSMPRLRELMKKREHSINQVLLQVFLHLMAETEDSNIIFRSGIRGLDYVKSQAKLVLEAGGALSEIGMAKVRELDEELIKKNISSGGSADLLAVTILLYLSETPEAF